LLQNIGNLGIKIIQLNCSQSDVAAGNGGKHVPF
jgi:hypothetical protein